ncbi:PEP/pyruvate-binding domain-containing protein [Crystallibacter degradans]|uniref:PEP/pyruvate-binding domain-containing protein n=1 Tax=Crystallibacter degradans TaxID=2726743 RepID=UPI0014736BDE|nr:PEP/pyruvate-binding domain-containing protein [Arthrobacter sp. SF27]NMR29316.1 phosphoenolpyruvate synthase [Arthrobacter sp. SF27]
MTESALVGRLAGFGAGDIALAGGKGANLGELIRTGFPVPDGFVITTRAYATLLDSTPLGAKLAELLQSGAHGASIRAEFAATSVPPKIRAAVADAYALLGSKPVAVRSSATAEDLPGAAFAGQQDTYLNVVGEDAVIQAVADCWASLWTDRAITYRQRQGIDPHEVAIAVVVQEMVPAEMAGVMFGANPVTGARDEIVVDASGGLGEAVVSGLVTPDHYVLDSAGRLRDYAPGRREVVIHAYDDGGTGETRAASENGGTSDVPGGSEGRGRVRANEGLQPSLSPAQLTELARLARQAAELFGRPQDMEWAVAGDRIYVLQSRPMTALPPQPLKLNRFQKLMGPFFLEMFTQRPYPLDASGWMDQGIGAMLRGMAGSVGVRFPTIEQLLPEEDGVVVRLVPPIPRPTLRTLAAPLSIALRVRRFKPDKWTEDGRFTAFLAEVDQLNARDPELLRWHEVIRLAEDAFAAIHWITELRAAYLPGAFVPQAKLRLLLLLLGKPRLASGLVAGAETRTSQANRALEQLAEGVQRDPALSAAFDELATAELLVRLNEPEFAGFRADFDAFLTEYGHRETVSIVLSSAPTWSGAPDVVLGLVKAMLGERHQGADQTGQALRELERHPALRFGPLRRQVLGAVAGAKAGMAFREDTHFYATKLLPPLRRALLELGQRLAAAGVLESPDQVHHLRFDELQAMTSGGGGGSGGGAVLPAAERERYRRVVLAREAKRRELEGIPLLPTDALFAGSRRHGYALVSGTAASAGRAAGRVRVIRSPVDFGTLVSGEILVCPYTNPSWTPLFQRAAAVVVDAGGLGSHAAIVAREYGIPAVMGTGTGTDVLRDGQQVLVDGSAGLVLPAGDERA